MMDVMLSLLALPPNSLPTAPLRDSVEALFRSFATQLTPAGTALRLICFSERTFLHVAYEVSAGMGNAAEAFGPGIPGIFPHGYMTPLQPCMPMHGGSLACLHFPTAACKSGGVWILISIHVLQVFCGSSRRSGLDTGMDDLLRIVAPAKGDEDGGILDAEESSEVEEEEEEEEVESEGAASDDNESEEDAAEAARRPASAAIEQVMD
jgi:hypothetical protein